MSETVHYKGILKEVKRYEGETLEEQCKRLMENKDLPSYYDTYEEYLLDENYRKITIQNGIVYRVEKEEVDPYSDIFNARMNENGEIEFEVRYYNGGCGFDEAIEEAVKNIKLKNDFNTSHFGKIVGGIIMKYRAVLHDTDADIKRIESIWVKDKHEANRIGEEGLKMYGGTHFTIEEKEES